MSDQKLLRIIGRNVADARLRANLTQECLAELVGVEFPKDHRHPIAARLRLGELMFTGLEGEGWRSEIWNLRADFWRDGR